MYLFKYVNNNKVMQLNNLYKKQQLEYKLNYNFNYNL